MAHAQICATALCAITFFLVFTGVAATECNNSTCVNGECVLDTSDSVQIYRCQCHDNWYGNNCTEFICDRIDEYPCGNNGTCYPQDNNNTYGCSCDEQYSGDHCETSHLNCTNASCNGDGNCSDNAHSPSGYQCDCEAGFNGNDCEININDCEGVNCNNGTCVDGINDYTCECFVNYTGPHCDHPNYCAIHSVEETNGCDDGVCCENGGTCYNDLVNERHECNCIPPWIPIYGCRRAVQPCVPHPCQNNGTCEVHGVDYVCHCGPNFTGKSCENQIVPCTNNTCHNNGTCTAEMMSDGQETGQHCQCLCYYTGDLCEIYFDPCTNKCQNNGTCQSSCINDGEYNAVCSCTEYFTGENCTSDINECSTSNPCQNNATCINLHGSFNCVCQDGFTGERCETNIDDCVDVTCENNGSCVDLVNDFECNCTPEYSGKFCQWHSNQTCALSQRPCFEVHTINCTDNYEGTVSTADGNGFECLCIEGFIGERCEAKVLQCQDNMVCGGPERKLNCTEGNHMNDYRCDCRYGYAGDRCEIDIDLCENSPCQNGGTCDDRGSYHTCSCPAGYTGYNCSIVLCNNTNTGITCVRDHTANCTDGPYGPVCTCEEGFTGNRCETVFNACDSSPCHSMATCTPHGNDYTCNCPGGYSGRDCTICSMRFCNCPVDDCDVKAGNGICNEECRTEVCHWDSDECVATYIPPDSAIPTVAPTNHWARCDPNLNCQDLFNNGECNMECANPDCLLDGIDCLPKNKTCPFKEECENDNYQNGQCTERCNIEDCQFDGGDCEEPEEQEIVDGLLVIILVLPDGVGFEGTLRAEFLIALGDILNCIPIVANATPIMASKETPSRIERQSVNNGTGTTSWNVTVNLDTTYCEELCISSASEASDIVNVHISRKTFPPTGYDVSHVSSRAPSEEPEDDQGKDSGIPVLYIAVPTAVVLVLVVLGVVVGVKRKRASATWHPNDKRNSRADGERDTPSPSRRRSTMGDPVGQEETISLKSIRDDDVEFGDALKKMRRGPKYAWADVEHPAKDKKQHPIKETSFVGQEAEDARMWANLQYNDMRDYSRLKSALQLMEQKTNAGGRHRDINAKGPGGHTPLMMAVMQTSVAVMRGSLESKEEPMPEGAVANACVSIKDLLGMKADVNAKNDRGQTTLHIATACCTSEAVRQLIESGSDINAQDIDGWTPLHVAVGAAAHSVFRILLYHKGVNIDAQDRNGMTPLILASKDCAVTMAKQLLDRQAEPGIADHKGKTALHWAASVNNVDGIRLLLHSNANKDIQDHRGQSPLFLAAREGHIEAVRLLLECFANRNIVDNMDRSPMMIAEERKHSAVARMLGEWNITALSHDSAVAQALAHASHMATTMASPSVVRRRQPADSFFANQMDTPHPNVPQPCEMFCPAGNGNAHPKIEYSSPLDYHHPCINGDQIPIGSTAPSSIQPSASIHDQLTLTHQGTALHSSNGHAMPSISVDSNNCALPPHLMPPNFSPSGNATSLAVTRVNSSSSGSPASVLSPSNTSPLTHIDEPMIPATSSYPTMTTVGHTVSSYQRDSTGNESLGSDNNILLAENASFPTPPSATYPYSPLSFPPDSVYLTPPPDPESPERWLSSPGKGQSPNLNDLSTINKRPMTNLPLGVVSEPPPPYRPPYPSEMAYTVAGQ